MNISVFCGSSQPRDPLIAVAAQKLGRAIAQGGHTLLYGGSNLGLMGHVSSAALDAGGTVVAVIPTFFSEEVINSQKVSRIVRVDSMSQRKEYFIDNSDLFIALPGGIGTLDEVMEILVSNQLGHLRDSNHTEKPVLLYNHNGFYDTLLQFMTRMKEEGFLNSGKASKLMAMNTIEELLANESFGA